MTMKEDIEKYAESFLIIISQEEINQNKKKDGSFMYKNKGEQLEEQYEAESFKFTITKKGNEVTVKEEKKEENKQLVTIYRIKKETNTLYIKMITNNSEKELEIKDTNYALDNVLPEWIKDRIKDKLQENQKVLKKTIKNDK